MTDKRKIENSLAAIAAEWHLRMSADRVSTADKVGFSEWFNASPENLREFAEISTLWGGFEGFEEDFLARYAPAEAAPEVVELYPGTGAGSGWELGASRRSWWAGGLAAAASILLIVGIVVSNLPEPLHGAVYRTAKGERQTYQLQDGSSLTLNTQSLVTVQMTDNERRLVLRQGEAIFDVTKDAARPFLVEAGGRTVRAIGTRFNVAQKGDEILVTVLEGVVHVTAKEAQGAAPTAPAAELTVGEQLVYGDSSASEKESGVDVETVTAWRNGELIFDSQPLRTVIAEFNRYNDGIIVIGGPTLGDVTVSGTFDINDTAALIPALEQITGVRAVAVAGKVMLLLPGDAG